MLSLCLRSLRRFTLLSLLASPGWAQGSGFTDGELILYTPAAQGSSSTAGAILRIDPSTGTTQMLLDLWSTPSSKQGVTYDAFRERVVFYGSFPSSSDPLDIWAVDGFGNATPFNWVLTGFSPHAFTSGSGGRLYFHEQANFRLHYYDAADQLHVLQNAAGTGDFFLSGNAVRNMHYDAGTNSLLLAHDSFSVVNCAGQTTAVTIIRLQLSADGTRVLGQTACSEFVVDPNGGSNPVGLSRGPAGSVAMVVDTNSNNQQPRMSLIDPETVAVLPFASNGHAFAAATNAGCWSSARSQMVILDTGNNVLRAFSFGETSAGTIITPSMQISSPGGSGEVATLIEIGPGGCSAGVGTYCTAKTTSSGCVPRISATGSPSASAPSGFVIRASQVESNQNGIFFYGLNGAANVPFLGGTLCAQAPLVRTPPISSGGGGACGGVFQFDFNAYLAGGGNPSVGAGSVVHGQFWFRDPAHPVGGSGLTDAITFTVCP